MKNREQLSNFKVMIFRLQNFVKTTLYRYVKNNRKAFWLIQNCAGEGSRGVVVNVLECGLKVSEVELQ